MIPVWHDISACNDLCRNSPGNWKIRDYNADRNPGAAHSFLRVDRSAFEVTTVEEADVSDFGILALGLR